MGTFSFPFRLSHDTLKDIKIEKSTNSWATLIIIYHRKGFEKVYSAILFSQTSTETITITNLNVTFNLERQWNFKKILTCFLSLEWSWKMLFIEKIFENSYNLIFKRMISFHRYHIVFNLLVYPFLTRKMKKNT